MVVIQLQHRFNTGVLTHAVVHSFMRFFASVRRLFLCFSTLCLLLTCAPASGAQADSQNAQTDAPPDAQVGSPQDFAALTIRPSGPEELDLTTGVTTLPQGGEISYRAEDVTLGGEFIRYLEGDFVEVRGAAVTGDFGTLQAPQLRFDVGAQTLNTEGRATFSGDALELTANTLLLDLASDTAVLGGQVTSKNPEFSAQRVLVDLSGSRGLLVGPYTYQNGPVGLRGGVGQLLALSWDASGALSAASEVPATLQTRFAAYLP